MIQAVGEISIEHQELVKKVFLKHDLDIEFTSIDRLADITTISFDKKSSRTLNQRNLKFYNWDLLFSVLGPNDTQGEIKNKLDERIKILKAVSSRSRPC